MNLPEGRVVNDSISGGIEIQIGLGRPFECFEYGRFADGVRGRLSNDLGERIDGLWNLDHRWSLGASGFGILAGHGCERLLIVFRGNRLTKLLDLHLGVGLESCTGRDEVAKEDILLESLQIIDGSLEGRFREDLGGLLEGGPGQEGFRRKPRLALNYNRFVNGTLNTPNSK